MHCHAGDVRASDGRYRFAVPARHGHASAHGPEASISGHLHDDFTNNMAEYTTAEDWELQDVKPNANRDEIKLIAC